MKIPRNQSGNDLIQKLSSFGYYQTPQSGSHIRLTRKSETGEQHITVPNHSSLRLGTLSNILKEVAIQIGSTKEELIKKLYS